MTMSEEPRRFDAALHEAVTGLEAPNPDSLYDGALSWKLRRIKRRRSIVAALVATVVVVAAGASAAGLAGAGQGTAPAGPAPAASGGPAPSASSAWSGASLGKYMARTLWSLLPQGSKPYTDGSMPWLEGTGYALTSSGGDWDATGEVQLTYRGQNISFQLVVRHGSDQDGDWGSPVSCAEATAPPDPKAPCTQIQLDGGTLVIYDGPDTVPAVAPSYFWTLPNDLQIQVGVADGQAQAVTPTLTEQQIESVITSSAWNPVLEAAPAIASCRSGLQPVGQIAGAEPKYWQCPNTGKKYPFAPADNEYQARSYSSTSSTSPAAP